MPRRAEQKSGPRIPRHLPAPASTPTPWNTHLAATRRWPQKDPPPPSHSLTPNQARRLASACSYRSGGRPSPCSHRRPSSPPCACWCPSPSPAAGSLLAESACGGPCGSRPSLPHSGSPGTARPRGTRRTRRRAPTSGPPGAGAKWRPPSRRPSTRGRPQRCCGAGKRPCPRPRSGALAWPSLPRARRPPSPCAAATAGRSRPPARRPRPRRSAR
mmetsp:Transcript_57231/g.177619  ORF Transcript_57231/g.177619 Transcript_57231/m.177619 type:complete len:215 (-) Transcript_57231:607-1251(-)